MKFIYKSLLAALALTAAFTASALDLPVKTVNGRQYYYYRAGSGESVHGISIRLGLTREQIVQYNPGVADGVRRGTVLYFPVDDFAEAEPAEVADTAAVEPAAVPEVEKQSRVLVALPFGLDSGAESRQNRHALDFYKGFLIAADTLSDRRGMVQIEAIDAVSATAVPDTAISAAAVAILPENDEAFDALSARCTQAGTYVLNLFSVKDTSYLSNPCMIQANIPAQLMYRKAADGLFRTYPEYVPVIIRNISGRNEKDPFTAYLTGLCDSLGREYLRIDYTGNLATADLEILEANPTKNYVIVPSSGTLAEFNKFAYVVRNFRDSRRAPEEQPVELAEEPDSAAGSDITQPQKIALFGYPDWIAFRSDAEELLHTMEATIYSRFYDDYDSFTARNIASDFVRWYGEPIMESVPSQGLLGFDAGCFILKNMRNNGGEFRPDGYNGFRGVQSTFDFQRVPGGGFVNTALYIISFQPYGRISATVL